MTNNILISYCHCNKSQLSCLKYFWFIFSVFCDLRSKTNILNKSKCHFGNSKEWIDFSGLFHFLEASFTSWTVSTFHPQACHAWGSLFHNTSLCLSPSVSFTWTNPHYHTGPVQSAGYQLCSNASFSLDLPSLYNLAYPQVWELG